MVLIAVACLAVLGAGGWWWLRTPPFAISVNPDRNILLVTIDTLRADVLGSYGGRAMTPNLDRLAATGARFAFAHAHAVVTLPSHATILTGRYPYEHGIRDNTGYRLAPGQATAASLLKARGFATGAFVGGFPLDHRFGLGAGFDVYDDKLDPGAQWRALAIGSGAADAVVAIGDRLDRTAGRQVVRLGPRLRSARAPTARRRNGRRASLRIRTSAKCPGRTPRSARSSSGSRPSRGRRWSSSPPITARASASTAS